MKLTNPWVGYLDRSYKTIKTSILTRLRGLTPEMTDLSDSNLLVVMVGIVAGVAEQLGYYIDSAARELYLLTARKLTSVLKIVKLINYRVRARISATVDISFTIPVPLNAGVTLTIPKDTIVATLDGIQFVTTEAKSFLGNTTRLDVSARQRSLVPLTVIGVSSGLASQVFNLPIAYEDGTLVVEINAVTWEMVDDLSFSKSTDKHFYVTVPGSANATPTLIFGDGTHGAIPTNLAQIKVSYYLTKGSEGNGITPDSITTIVSTITLPTQVPAITEITVTNHDYPAGGTNQEGIAEIKKFAPLSLRTLDRAVTRQDYVDIAKLAPGVDKAAIFFNCGKTIKVYIAPLGGGIAAGSLLATTETFMNARKMVTTFLEVKAAGESYIRVNVEATAKFRVNPTIVEADIKEALIQAYSGDTSDINKPVRLSDIIALIDNLERVDFLSVHNMSLVPYARPLLHERQLTWAREVMGGSTIKIKWKLIYTGGIFKLYRDAQFIQDIAFSTETTYQDILKLQIDAAPVGAVNGDVWEFYTYPYNKDVVLDDFTVPRIHPYLDYVTIQVNSQSYIL